MVAYEVFMKHAKRVCENASVTRPVLGGVKHLENGDAICTDSHRLYVAKGVHERTDGAVITPGGKMVEGNYPDVSRIIPDPAYAKQSLQLEVKELLAAADTIATIGKIAEKIPVLEFKEDVIQYLNFQCSIKYSFDPERFEEHICANAIYLLDAMKLFKAVGCQTVTLNFYGRMRLFTLTNENEDLLVLILPVRKY